MRSLVSIMIPAYNQPHYAEQAVKSALAQDYENLEIIVSDDSSNQETYDLLQPLFDKRFSYYKTDQNLGRVANYRKLLFEYAKGDWAVMLDGDDYYTDDTYISQAIEIIEQNSSVVLVGAGIRIINEQSGNVEESRLVDATIIFDGKDIIKKKLSLPNHQTDIYLSSLARKLDFYRSPSTGSDSESLFRMCLRGEVAYLAGTVAVWRIHGQNATYTHDMNRQIKELSWIDSVYKDALNFLDKRVAQEWRKYMYKGMSIHLLSQAFLTNKYSSILNLLFRFGNLLGTKLTLIYTLRLFNQFKRRITNSDVSNKSVVT